MGIFRGYAKASINGIEILLNKFLFNTLSTCRFISNNKLDCRKENVIALNRKCYIKNNICYIPLQNNTVAFCDSKYYDKVNKYNWCLNNNGYVISSINNHIILLHRFIKPTVKYIDHINHNKLDNRSENLRIVTKAQNNYNKIKCIKNNIVKYKNVYLDKRYNKYIAYITFNYKKIHIGTFNTPEEAAEAYNKKAKELFGEYACLNVIPKKKKSIF